MCTNLRVKTSRERKTSEHPVSVNLSLSAPPGSHSTRGKSCRSSAVTEKKSLFWKHAIVFCSSYQVLPSRESKQN